MRDSEKIATLESEVARLCLIVFELLPYAEKTDDEGPYDEGWQSEKLMDLIRRANIVLGFTP